MRTLKTLLVALLAVFAPIQKTIMVVALMITSDLITGILAARKRNEPISSAGLRRTIVKLLVFEGALCLGFLAEHNIPGSLPFTNIIGGFISLTEMTSITENLNELTGRSIMSSLLVKLGSANAKD